MGLARLKSQKQWVQESDSQNLHFPTQEMFILLEEYFKLVDSEGWEYDRKGTSNHIIEDKA